MVRRISNMVQVSYTRQKEPLGLGHAVLVAKDLVGDEPFAVLLGDVLIPARILPLGSSSTFTKLPALARSQSRKFPATKTHLLRHLRRRTRAATSVRRNDCCASRSGRKTKNEEAPSNLAITGRYVLPSAIFDCLERTKPGAGGEIQLTDAMRLLAKEQGLWAYIYEEFPTMRETNSAS